MTMTIEHAVALCASTHNVSERSILGRRRGARIDAARRVVMLLLHKQGWTPARIGLYMGRHRTTVLSALGLRGRSTLDYAKKYAAKHFQPSRAARAAEEKP